MKREAVFTLLIIFFSFLTTLPVLATLSDMVTFVLNIQRWQLFIGSFLATIITFFAGLIFLEE